MVEETYLIDVYSFDDVKTKFHTLNTKCLTFLIMLANGELMERCDRGTLDRKEDYYL